MALSSRFTCVIKLAASLIPVILMLTGGHALANNKELNSLFDEYWDSQMQAYPTWATYIGDHRFDEFLTDHSATAYAARLEEDRTFLRRAESITLTDMSAADSLNHELFIRMLKDGIEGASFRNELMPISQQGNPAVNFAELPTFHPFSTVEDLENYIARLHAFAPMVDQVLANLKTGVSEGLVPPKVTMKKVLPQLEALMEGHPRDHVLSGPAHQISDSISEAERDRLKAEIIKAVRNQVVPAYRKLHKYIRNRYLRECRDEHGIWALPDGAERYAYAVRHYTTTDMTPEEIHALGIKTLHQINSDMRAVTRKMSFFGDLKDFIHALRSNPRYYYQTADSLMDGFRAHLKRMDDKLPELFGRLPRQGYDLKEIESFRAEAAPAAYYYGAPDDGSRPGYFYVNTFRPETRPKFTMEALAYHEAVPGHHLQLTIQQELKDLPTFRRHGGYTAFVEGWGLYSERLPKEVGMYKDHISEFGRLTFEAWRAARLVVDTGIHHMKWSREKAIALLEETTALSKNDVVSEVERYIAWPGQALAYKIGQMRILEIRAEAEQRLGDDFDIREFHDALLEEGALPLDLLSKKMTRWTASEIRSNWKAKRAEEKR